MERTISSNGESLDIPALDRLLAQPHATTSVFYLGADEVLEAVIEGTVWVRVSAIAAYRGNLSFLREGEVVAAVPGFWDAAREDYRSMMTRVRGRGRIYLSGIGERVTIVHAGVEAVIIAQSDARRFDLVETNTNTEPSDHEGQESPLLALRALRQPLGLPVFRGVPLYCDAARTVNWSGELQPELSPGIRVRRHGQRRIEDALQMKFDGEGTVTIGGAE
ncbi:MAG: hypothetical protein ACREJO_05335 [Phycisphaerales bacterium]